MTYSVLVQGKHCRPCVSCHKDGTFSFYCPLRLTWISNAQTVPTYVRSLLPDDEMHCVERKLRELGRL
jgi:hypothetical protein